MRKFKIIMSIVVICAILGICACEIYAATNISLKINGDIEYYATEVGATYWGGYALGDNHNSGEAMTFSDGVVNAENSNGAGNVYTISGRENNYLNILANFGKISIGGDVLYMYIFVKNTGDRYMIPSTNLIVDKSKFNVEGSSMYFDCKGADTIDPLEMKKDYLTPATYLSAINSNLSKGIAFSSNMSLVTKDTYLQVYKITPKIDDIVGGTSSFEISLNLYADIDYKSNDILTVYQEINATTTKWTKYGHNGTLSAAATKIENNSLQSLADMLEGANGSNVVSSITDDYYTAPVYKDIDVVNIDIATGEPIGKLSDPNYEFEWYGGRVTLPAGTTLASGRRLTTNQTFTVDVYTYYPTMYMRRWVAGGRQWLSVSDKEFAGCVEIPEYYVATFESTLFQPKFQGSQVVYYYLNADGTYLKDSDGISKVTGTSPTYTLGGTTYKGTICYEIAYNEYGITPRSYVYDYSPLTDGSANYQMTNYLYENNSGFSATSSATQDQMLAWASNLTKKWEVANQTSVEGYLPNASLAQGENYVAYIYNWLYIIKYANNDAQEVIGYGNTYTRSLYVTSGVNINTPTGNVVIGTGKDNSYVRYESQKGSGTIGVYNTTSENNQYKKSSNAMAYGYEYTGFTDGFNNATGKVGLYANSFLTYKMRLEDGTYKRVLLDGYVGSDKYTSVFCIGQCNAWGNIYKWVFGNAVSGTEASDGGVDIHLFTTFDNYNYATKNWYTTSSFAGYEKLNSGNYNYAIMSYNLPRSGYYRYLGTSGVTSGNGLQSLVGVQTSESSTGNYLGDYYYVTTNTRYLSNTFGVLRGGSTYNASEAGPFCFYGDYGIDGSSWAFGFRLSLV